jgi:hypothetical protein
MLVAHLLGPTAQYHSVQKNECENHVGLYFFIRYIITNVISEIVENNFVIYHC